jgi:hypothetical protein
MSLWSLGNALKAIPSCLIWDAHCILHALPLAAASAGKRIAANMAIMAMTTNSSIKVNPCFPGFTALRPAKPLLAFEIEPFIGITICSPAHARRSGAGTRLHIINKRSVNC